MKAKVISLALMLAGVLYLQLCVDKKNFLSTLFPSETNEQDSPPPPQ